MIQCGTCETCRYWQSESPGSDAGLCHYIMAADHRRYGITVMGAKSPSHIMDPFLVLTVAGFGCVKWQESQ